MRRILVLAVVAASLGAGLAGCGDDDRLTVYSGRTENLVGPLLDRFSEETGTPSPSATATRPSSPS